MRQLQLVTASDAACDKDIFGKAIEQWTHPLDCRGRAADQQVQPPFFRLFRRAGHRGVDEITALVTHLRGQRTGRAGDRGGTVHNNRPRPQRGQCGTVANQHILDLRCAGHADQQNITGFRQLGRTAPRGAAQRHQIIGGLIARMIEKAQVPALLQDVLCNAVPHKPDADNSDFCHLTDLFPFPRGQNHAARQKGTGCSMIGRLDHL